MHGIQETKELVVFVARLSSSLGAALEDGKLGIVDMARLAPVLMKAGAALEGIDKVPVEMSDLDAAEREELIEAVKGELSLPQEKLEEAVFKCLSVASKLHDVYLLLKK